MVGVLQDLGWSAPQKDHRMTEWLRLERSSGGHLVQPPCSSRATQTWLPRTVSRQLLTISKDGDCTTSLANLLQCSGTPTVKMCFLRFKQILLCSILCPFPPVLPLGTTEKSLAWSSLLLLDVLVMLCLMQPRTPTAFFVTRAAFAPFCPRSTCTLAVVQLPIVQLLLYPQTYLKSQDF